MSALPRGSTVRRDAGLYGYERALRRAGLAPIAGVDEAGRGACAGPLVAAAAILPEGKAGIVPGLADSKLLTEKARERCYEQVLQAGAGLVGGGDRVRRVRPAGHARGQRRGAAPRAGPPRRAPGVRPDRRVPGRRPRRARAGGLEGRPGRRLHLGRVGAGQGDPRPDHGRAGRRLPGVRLQDPQGLHHRRARRAADRARAVRRAPHAVRERTAGRGARAGRPGHNEPVVPAPVLPTDAVHVSLEESR